MHQQCDCDFGRAGGEIERDSGVIQKVCVAYRGRWGGGYHRPWALCRSLLRICLARLLAAKIEFKTIASKITQHPAATIESIKLRRRVIAPFIQTRLNGGGAAAGHKRATPNHAGTHGLCGARIGQSGMTVRTIEFWASPATKLAR